MKQQTLRPSVYPDRAPVGDPDEWDDIEYVPHFFEIGLIRDMKHRKRPGWAGPTEPKTGDYHPTFQENALVPMDISSCAYDEFAMKFRNPKGKTGLQGRGMLGCYGPNHAADAIVTRTNPDTRSHEVLLVTKNVGDTSCLAFPAGMVEPGCDVPATLRKELVEEALEDTTAVDELFSECRKRVVYRGHVDDFRNTDEAWMETTAVWFHASPQVAAKLALETTDTQEIRGVAWYPVHSVTQMYASHIDWLETVRGELKKMPLGFVSHAQPEGVPTTPFVSHAFAPLSAPPAVSASSHAKKARLV